MPGGKTKTVKEQKLQGENIEAGNKGALLTNAIARDEWTAFFETFSNRHQGWLVTIEVFGSDIGAQVEAHDLPLQGITAESNRSNGELISIIVGDTPDNHVTHTIAAPTHVALKRTEQGADEAIEIESEDRATLLRFPASARN
jgi:hypothetical protein